MELPITDKDLISRCRNEYDTAVTAGADTSAAGLRLVWALVHARSTSTDVPRGIQLAELLMDKQDTDPQFKRELVYLRAVGKYRVGKLLEARRQLDELLKVSPDSHQAHQLKQAVEDQIIKEGLVGVGIVGGLLGVGAVILSAAFSRR